MPGDRKTARREVASQHDAMEGPSVFVAQTKLNQPSRHCRFSDLSKARRGRNLHGRWEPEYRMVPQVEDVHARLEYVTLFYVKALDEREVPVLLHRSTERISGKISIATCPRRAVRNQWSLAHEVRIKEMVDPAANRTSSVYLLHGGNGACRAARSE